MKLENEAWRYRKRRSREDVKRLIDELKPADRLAGLTVGTVAVVPCVNDCDVPSGNQIFGDLNFLQSRIGYLRRIDPYICSVAAPFRSTSARALCWRSLFGRRGNWRLSRCTAFALPGRERRVIVPYGREAKVNSAFDVFGFGRASNCLVMMSISVAGAIFRVHAHHRTHARFLFVVRHHHFLQLFMHSFALFDQLSYNGCNRVQFLFRRSAIHFGRKLVELNILILQG